MLYRFAQSKDIDRGSQGYQVWRDVLAPVYFIGRTSRGEPFLTGDKSDVNKPNFNSEMLRKHDVLSRGLYSYQICFNLKMLT